MSKFIKPFVVSSLVLGSLLLSDFSMAKSDAMFLMMGAKDASLTKVASSKSQYILSLRSPDIEYGKIAQGMSGHIEAKSIPLLWKQGERPFIDISPNASLQAQDQGSLKNSFYIVSRPNYNQPNDTLSFHLERLGDSINPIHAKQSIQLNDALLVLKADVDMLP